MSGALAALALAIDRLVGDPDAVWRRVPHPVAGFGALIAAADRTFNRPHWPDGVRRLAGLASILVLLMLAALLGHAIHLVLAPLGWPGLVRCATHAFACAAQTTTSLFDTASFSGSRHRVAARRPPLPARACMDRPLR